MAHISNCHAQKKLSFSQTFHFNGVVKILSRVAIYGDEGQIAQIPAPCHVFFRGFRNKAFNLLEDCGGKFGGNQMIYFNQLFLHSYGAHISAGFYKLHFAAAMRDVAFRGAHENSIPVMYIRRHTRDRMRIPAGRIKGNGLKAHTTPFMNDMQNSRERFAVFLHNTGNAPMGITPMVLRQKNGVQAHTDSDSITGYQRGIAVLFFYGFYTIFIVVTADNGDTGRQGSIGTGELDGSFRRTPAPA